MLILRLALASLRSRKLTTALTVASIALSVTLLVGIETVRAGVRDSFAGTIRGVDLIVGARGGTLQVLLSSVFGIGSPSGSVQLRTMERWQQHPAVKWVVPYSLGDSHRGFRVVGTSTEFYERYRFRKDGRITFAAGGVAQADSDVVVGSEVAERLNYTVGTPVVVTHGLRDIGTSNHEAHPFRVVGVLARTFTPIDRSVYVTLEGIEAMHEEGEFAAAPSAAPPMPVKTGSREQDAGSRKQAVIAANKRRAAAIPTTPPAGVPMAMPGAEPPPGTPMVMPGASPPPGTPTVMPGASPPPGATLVMPGAEPPPQVMEQVNAAAEKAREAAKAKAVAAAVTSVSKTDTTDTAEAEHDHGDDQITSFFVGTKNRFEALMLQREMNTDLAEPLTAIIPGVALGELWQNIGSAEVGLRVIAMFAVLISITGMLVALYSSLEARRREMAILRAIGAGPRTILALLVLESTMLAFLGCVIGVAIVYAGLALGQSPIEQRFGIHLALRALGETEYGYLAMVMIAGMLIGFVPAWKAYRTSLVDGLSPRA
ncbi:ABC transporter permease [Gemmatimonas phototrophica]|uniref:ABC transporter permease n=1 Tax=Gemmatimonas phototrophica TaxID=1379270 RepID=UPI00047EDED2|nr:ABC transporter permease [Gemmatimonas phototrophica]